MYHYLIQYSGIKEGVRSIFEIYHHDDQHLVFPDVSHTFLPHYFAHIAREYSDIQFVAAKELTAEEAKAYKQNKLR